MLGTSFCEVDVEAILILAFIALLLYLKIYIRKKLDQHFDLLLFVFEPTLHILQKAKQALFT